MHGLAIPLAKFFFGYLPRSVSRSFGPDTERSFRMQKAATTPARSNTTSADQLANKEQELKADRRMYRIGGSVIPETEDVSSSSAEDPEIRDLEKGSDGFLHPASATESSSETPRAVTPIERRIIRFPDDPKEETKAITRKTV